MENIYVNSRNILFRILALTFVFGAFSFHSLHSQYERKLVFEEFTEVWCGSCGFYAPMLKKWLNANPEIIPVTYYSYFKTTNGDEYIEKTDYTARKNFYKVPFYPYSNINGVEPPHEKYPGFPCDSNVINELIDTLNKSTPIKIDMEFTNNGLSGNVKISVKSAEDLTNKLLFVCITEKNHDLIQQPNGITEAHHIFRKAPAGGNGVTFSISAGETKNFEYDYTIEQDINTDLYAVAIVQDPSTKYVYQAESVFKAGPNKIEEKSVHRISIYPNPVEDMINISLNTEDIITKIELYDLLGNQAISAAPEYGAKSLSIPVVGADNSKLSPGAYILKAYSGGKVFMEKVIVQ